MGRAIKRWARAHCGEEKERFHRERHDGAAVLPPQAATFAGANVKEKSSAYFGRNDGVGERQDARHIETKLEEDSGDLLGDLIRFVAALCLRQGRIVLDGGANADDEGLIADAADDQFGVVGFFGVGGAGDGFVAGGGEGRALGRTLCEVGGKLFGDVGH